MTRAGFPPDSHDAKALLEILESYPRDSLFQIEADELFEMAMGILGLGERQRVRLFVRRDPLDRFVACLVVHSARPLQHREPRAGRPDPARGVRRQRTSTGPCSCRSRCSRACTTSSTAPMACPRTTTWRRSSRGWCRRRGHGPTICARRWSRSTARSAGWPVQALRAGVPARLPLRLGGALGGGRHRPARGAGGVRASRSSACTARSRPRRAWSAASCSAPAACCSPTCCRRSSTWARGWSTSGPTRSPPDGATRCGSTTSGCESPPRTSSACATSSRRRSSACGAASSRTTASTGWCSRAGLSGRQITILRAIAKYLRQAGHRVLGRLHGAHAARPIPTSRRCWWSCSSPGSTPTSGAPSAGGDRRADRAGDRRGREPGRGPDPAQLPAWSAGDPAHELLPRDAGGGGLRSSLSFKLDPSGCRCCRCRGRGSRSSCTRRGSRACTCAAARWLAAGCAGRTGARTSAPRSSG